LRAVKSPAGQTEIPYLNKQRKKLFLAFFDTQTKKKIADQNFQRR